MLTGAQLQRLRFTEIKESARGRDQRRVMKRLNDLKLVSTLDRRIGGSGAGSAGHVYTLTSTARHLHAMQHGQPRPPARLPRLGAPFVAHALAISEIYVTLTEASRTDGFRVSTFNTEPACWHPIDNDRYLKPDAYLVLAATTHKDCWWLEIDQATESLPRITRKIRSYVDYLTTGSTGPDGVPPRILFTTPDTKRSRAIGK